MPHETCFRCKMSMSKPAAYITDALLPVCNDCLNILVEEYFWEKEDSLPHKVQKRGLKAIAQRSWDEVSHELEFYLSAIPSIIERGSEVTVRPPTKLIRSPEMQSIPLLRGA